MPNPHLSDTIHTAIGLHGIWITRLKTAITTGISNVTPEIAARDDCCDFGKWLYDSAIDASVRESAAYKVITRLHQEFHQSAASILTLALNGKGGEASALLTEDFTPRSEKLVRGLTKWRNETRDA